MIQLLMAALLCGPMVSQDEKGEVPTPERVEQALTELKEAFGKGEPGDRVQAIQDSTSVLDERVVEQIARGFKDGDRPVLLASIDALRVMKHPAAIDSLERYYHRNKKKLKKDEKLFPVVLRAIAQHGRPSSIEILIEDPQSVKTYEAIRARILGLGNIRSAEAVAAIFELSKRVGYNKIDRYMDDLRLALYRLSGEDKGPDFMVWEVWWRGVRKDYEVPAIAPKLDEDREKIWNRYWGIQNEKKGEDG